MMTGEELQARAAQKQKENRKFLQRIGKTDHRKLDDAFHATHDTVFAETDCLQCANCCKTTSPMFFDKDIERLSEHLRMKPAKFTETYLRVDEDGDYVLQTAPCPFLQADNYCSVYEARPKACRDYPHTDRKNMYQVLDLALKNTTVCPAVFEMVERLKKAYLR